MIYPFSITLKKPIGDTNLLMIFFCPAKEWIFPWHFTRQVSNLQATSAELPAGPAADPGAPRSPRATVFGERARNRMEICQWPISCGEFVMNS